MPVWLFDLLLTLQLRWMLRRLRGLGHLLHAHHLLRGLTWRWRTHKYMRLTISLSLHIYIYIASALTNHLVKKNVCHGQTGPYSWQYCLDRKKIAVCVSLQFQGKCPDHRSYQTCILTFQSKFTTRFVSGLGSTEIERRWTTGLLFGMKKRKRHGELFKLACLPTPNSFELALTSIAHWTICIASQTKYCTSKFEPSIPRLWLLWHAACVANKSKPKNKKFSSNYANLRFDLLCSVFAVPRKQTGSTALVEGCCTCGFHWCVHLSKIVSILDPATLNRKLGTGPRLGLRSNQPLPESRI